MFRQPPQLPGKPKPPVITYYPKPKEVIEVDKPELVPSPTSTISTAMTKTPSCVDDDIQLNFEDLFSDMDPANKPISLNDPEDSEEAQSSLANLKPQTGVYFSKKTANAGASQTKSESLSVTKAIDIIKPARNTFW